MADVDLAVTVSRSFLGLDPLEIASGPVYYLAQFLGAQVTWERQQVSSPWVDGDVTVSRRRGTVTEQVAVEVVAHSETELRDAMTVLVTAFTQDAYTLTANHGGAIYAYTCEAADYQNAMWTTPRLAAFQGQAVFSVPRRPVAVAGL